MSDLEQEIIRLKNMLENYESPEEIMLSSDLNPEQINELYENIKKISRNDLIQLFEKFGKNKKEKIAEFTKNVSYNTISVKRIKHNKEAIKERIRQLENDG